jgi:predicted GNAT superfamily acetyltransferase
MPSQTPLPVAAIRDEVIIRNCEVLEEMEACFALQQEVWRFSDAELIPVRLFVVAAKIGGQVIGAFVDANNRRNPEKLNKNGKQTELIGFALAIPGMRNGHSYLHSQMLAVRQQYRNRGLGRRMKLYQRVDALARGIALMEWTFDPLEIKNSYLNIEKLGAIARRYNVNQYGITSSPLQRGLPTDRLVAEWWMNSRRVQAAIVNAPLPKFECRASINVPAEVCEPQTIATSHSRALAVQKRNHKEFARCFAEGLSVLGYEPDDHGNGRFLLGEWEENCNY